MQKKEQLEKSRVCNSTKAWIEHKGMGRKAYGSFGTAGRASLIPSPDRSQVSVKPKLILQPGDNPNTLPSQVSMHFARFQFEVHMLSSE